MCSANTWPRIGKQPFQLRCCQDFGHLWGMPVFLEVGAVKTLNPKPYKFNKRLKNTRASCCGSFHLLSLDVHAVLTGVGFAIPSLDHKTTPPPPRQTKTHDIIYIYIYMYICIYTYICIYGMIIICTYAYANSATLLA